METLIYLDEMRKEYQRKVSSEVNHRKLLKQVHAQQPGLTNVSVDGIGTLMCRIGRRLSGDNDPLMEEFVTSFSQVLGE